MTIQAEFVSKFPHTTLSLRLWFPVHDEPTDLLEALRKIQWAQDASIRRLPALDGIQELNIHGPYGSGLFKGWTSDERRAHMKTVRTLLRGYGFSRIPHHKLTLAELL